MYSVTIMMCLSKRETKMISSQRREHKQCEQNDLQLIFVVCPRLFHSHLVTTPSRRMIFGCENWPMMLASLKKSCLCFSEYPGLRVLIATGISPRTRVCITPRKTSPNSPDWQRKSGKNVRAIAPWLYSTESRLASKAHTNTDDFLFADGSRVNFCDKLLDCNIWVLIHVWINVSLQRLELICKGKQSKNIRLNIDCHLQITGELSVRYGNGFLTCWKVGILSSSSATSTQPPERKNKAKTKD